MMAICRRQTFDVTLLFPEISRLASSCFRRRGLVSLVCLSIACSRLVGGRECLVRETRLRHRPFDAPFSSAVGDARAAAYIVSPMTLSSVLSIRVNQPEAAEAEAATRPPWRPALPRSEQRKRPRPSLCPSSFFSAFFPGTDAFIQTRFFVSAWKSINGACV